MATLFDRWRLWRAKRAMNRRIAALSEEERKAIFERSPYELYWAQGEGVSLVLKAKRDLTEAMVDYLGECWWPDDWRKVENKLIERTLKDEARATATSQT
ncbi:MAG TPA: hypothetical protein VK956_14020 [Verrucomicrobium sp.]|nr:hypothetical protein [Verrucomicrobium sp.]